MLLSDVAELLRRAGHAEESAALFTESLNARKASYGPEHPLTLASLNHVGLLLGEQGQLEEAKALMAEALEIRRRVEGDAAEGTLTAMNNLAALLRTEGDLAGAERLYQEAMATRRATMPTSQARWKLSTRPSSRATKCTRRCERRRLPVGRASQSRRSGKSAMPSWKRRSRTT
mgnify:CR=1 FL=1